MQKTDAGYVKMFSATELILKSSAGSMEIKRSKKASDAARKRRKEEEGKRTKDKGMQYDVMQCL